MPDFDNDNPDFDNLIAQAQRLREEGKDDEAIAKYEEVRKADSTRPELCKLMELYIKRKRFSSAIDLAIVLSTGTLSKYLKFSDISDLAEAANTYRTISALLVINPSETIDNPGVALSHLATCATILSQNDPDHIYEIQKTIEGSKIIAARLYGWSDFHTKCYLKYCSASEENLTETLVTLREWAQENPAAWFYVGELEIRRKGTWFDNVIEAYEEVPKNDPNYVRAMLQAAYYRECWADSEEDLGEPAFAAEIRYPIEECYANALEAAPLSQAVRLGYLGRHIERLLEEAAENGFDRDRIDRASKLIEEMYGVLAGSVAESGQSAGFPEAERQNIPLPHPELNDRYIAEHFQRQNQLAEMRHQEIREGMERLQEELKILREQLDQSLFKQEEITVAALETINRYVADRLGLPDVELGYCKEKLKGECDAWEKLEPDSSRCLATGDYILEKGAIDMEYSGVAIQYTKVLEIELKKNFIDPFIKFIEQKGLGFGTFFGNDPEKVTLGNICYALTPRNSVEWRLLIEFANSFGNRGQYLLRDFSSTLEKIKNIRDYAAHRGEVARWQAQSLRKQVLKILPKIVALRSH